jgi:hypothetical protein
MKERYYLTFAKNIYTQCGEDGIIDQLFQDLNISKGIVVEFGAWDGVYLSNTYNLWKNKGFQALLIEGDSTKATELKHLTRNYSNVECIEVFVSPTTGDPNSLDNILKKSSFKINKNNYAMVSIDIDSCDYFILDSIQEFLPKVIIIETNTQFDADTEYASMDQGCSIRSVVNLAESKGYTLVCHTGNAIFVRNDLVKKLPKSDYSIENLYINNPVNSTQLIDQFGNILNDIYFLRSEYNQLVEQEKQELNL